MIQINPAYLKDLSDSELSFLIRLAAMSQNNCIEISFNQLVVNTGTSRNTCQKNVKSLIEKSFIFRDNTFRENGGMSMNRYTINHDIASFNGDNKAIESKSKIKQYTKVVSDNKDIFIYVARDSWNGLYKIGIATDVKSRLTGLRVSNPNVEIIHSIKTKKALENQLHLKFESKRKYGEWFALDKKDLAFLLSMKDGFLISEIKSLDESDFPEDIENGGVGFGKKELDLFIKQNDLVVNKFKIEKMGVKSEFTGGNSVKCEFIASNRNGDIVIKRNFVGRSVSRCIRRLIVKGQIT